VPREEAELVPARSDGGQRAGGVPTEWDDIGEVLGAGFVGILVMLFLVVWPASHNTPAGM
jgi:hypothetical protein